MAHELPDSLQAKLDEYNRNFKDIDDLLGPDSVLETAADKESRVEATKDVLSHAQLVAARTLLEIMVEGESEGTRAKVAMWVLESNLGKQMGLEADKGIEDLIKRLQIVPEATSGE